MNPFLGGGIPKIPDANDNTNANSSGNTPKNNGGGIPKIPDANDNTNTNSRGNTPKNNNARTKRTSIHALAVHPSLPCLPRVAYLTEETASHNNTPPQQYDRNHHHHRNNVINNDDGSILAVGFGSLTVSPRVSPRKTPAAPLQSKESGEDNGVGSGEVPAQYSGTGNKGGDNPSLFMGKFALRGKQVDNCCEIDAFKIILQDALITYNPLVDILGIGDYCDSMDPRQQRSLAFALTSCHCSRENIQFPKDRPWEDPKFDPDPSELSDVAYELYDIARSDISNFCTKDHQSDKSVLVIDQLSREPASAPSPVHDNTCEVDAIKTIFRDYPGNTVKHILGVLVFVDYCDSMEGSDFRRLAFALTSCHCSRENIQFPKDRPWEDPKFDPDPSELNDVAYELYDIARSDISNFCTKDKKYVHETKEALTSLQNQYAFHQIVTIVGIIVNVLVWSWAPGYFVLVFILAFIFLVVAVAYEAQTQFALHFICPYFTEHWLAPSWWMPLGSMMCSQVPKPVMQIINEWFPYISLVGFVQQVFCNVGNNRSPTVERVFYVIQRCETAIQRCENLFVQHLNEIQRLRETTLTTLQQLTVTENARALEGQENGNRDQ